MLQWRGGKQSIQLLKENSINSYFTWTKWYRYVCHIKHAQKCYYTWQTQSKKYGIRSKKTKNLHIYTGTLQIIASFSQGIKSKHRQPASTL